MKKIFLAGLATVCVLAMGTTAIVAEAAPRRVRASGGCHRQLEAFWQQDCIRHDCAYVDADGDGICDNCYWHEDRHHCVDENGYCLNGSCSYDNCGYGHGTGYCRGYCNSVTPGAGTVSAGADSSQEAFSSGGNSQRGNVANAAETVPEDRTAQTGSAASWGSGSGTEAGNGSGYGSGSGYGNGAAGYGHHGGGHHSGRHGCH